jgi:lipopolysaccharide/colanic/teichoic acid biosynthesis glycosyltransferase
MSNSQNLHFQKLEFEKDFFLTPGFVEGNENYIFNEKLNEVAHLNTVLFKIQNQISNEQIVVFKFETTKGRIILNFKRYNKQIAYFKIIFDFIFYRFLGKTLLFHKIVSIISNYKPVVLSKAEGLGRLAFCGFEILDELNKDNLIYVKVRKTHDFQLKKKETRYGFIIKMPRVGKNGGKINVYKIRTMHPYAEYIHGYILKSNGYNNKGKPANDYRITVWGKYLRKYWIDELPQLLNLLKGDMKLIGIRPVSERYLLDIPEDVRNKRLQFKPGCIPPYLGFHFGTTKESIIKAEEMYMKAYEKNPLKTDIFVFFKSIYNILIKKHRSA